MIYKPRPICLNVSAALPYFNKNRLAARIINIGQQASKLLDDHPLQNNLLDKIGQSFDSVVISEPVGN